VVVVDVAEQATSPVEERQDVTVLYNRMTLAELQDAFSFNVSLPCFSLFEYVFPIYLIHFS